ncbi:MAG TPA: Na+/H+ antiporter NhaC [Tetragenococcus sp.]|nr:Na+/H+ antiporter NhaC [Tetragenococcus sp.]
MSEEPKKLSFKLALLPILFMIATLVVGVIVLDLPIEIPLLVSAFFTGLMAMWLGRSYQDIENEVVLKISKILPALFIILSVGLLVASWITSGTVPYLVYLGLSIIRPQFLPILAFLLCAAIGMGTGSSWAAAGTVGTALMAIARGMDFPVAIVAGAIVSGAYTGDTLSPLGGEPALVAASSNVTMTDHLKHAYKTGGIGFIICLIFYTLIGFVYGRGKLVDSGYVEEIIKVLGSIYHFDPLNIILVLLPLVVAMVGMVKGKPTVAVMLISTVIASLVSVLTQGFAAKTVANSLISGFKIDYLVDVGVKPAAISDNIATLLEVGGLSSMMNIIQVSFCAFAFVGTLNMTGALDIILERITKIIKSTGQLILTTAVSGVLSIAISGSNTICFVLLGDIFQKEYVRKGLKKTNLSRTLQDSITAIEAIVPWSLAGIFMSGTLQVPVLKYLPWTLFAYVPLILTIVYGFTGIGIAKEDPSLVAD